MFHRLEDARSLLTGEGPLDARLESSFMQILVLRLEDLPEPFRADFKWLLNNRKTEEGASDQAFARRMGKFIDGLLRWREENR